MKKIILILGGARSGKSRYAQDMAKNLGKKVGFIATCIPEDDEMKKRIALHKKSRPRHWVTIEEPKNIKSILNRMNDDIDIVIIDCLGLFISNLLLDGLKEKRIEKEIKSIMQALIRSRFSTIIVSNDVGCGIVPSNILARKFRDIVGMSNQIIAKKSDVVISMQSGMPVFIKGELKNAKIEWDNKKN